MAERANPESLQPSLLDRLTDNAPTVKAEASDRVRVNAKVLRKAVFRDLAWLLNNGNLESVLDLSRHDDVRKSVLNFGMPDLAGLIFSSIEPKALQRLMRDVIATYEPRIIPSTLKVTANASRDQMNRTALSLDIEGDIWAHPLPQRLFLRSEVDFESGNIVLSDASGRG